MTEQQAVRRSIFPQNDDSWESIAAREFPQEDPAAMVSQLQSWNMHVFMRPVATGNPILPSDVIFLEAPRPQ